MKNELTTNPYQTPAVAANMVVPKTGTALVRTDQHRAIAEVQAAMVVAQSNPRDPVAAMDRILNECDRPTLAHQAVYEYSRGGTAISGPSIRLAETIARQWGNVQYGIRELEQHRGESTVQAFAWDMETNVRREVTFTVPHVRDTKRGRVNLEDARDIYETVANMGARRVRACILGIVPGDVADAAVARCEETLKANADTSAEAMTKLLAAFADYRVKKEQIEARIQRRLDAITPGQVVTLRKIYASLRDGMSAPSDWFEQTVDVVATPVATTGTEGVKAKLRGKRKAAAAPEPTIENPDAEPTLSLEEMEEILAREAAEQE